jgi:hypothetical protein
MSATKIIKALIKLLETSRSLKGECDMTTKGMETLDNFDNLKERIHNMHFNVHFLSIKLTHKSFWQA